MSLDSGEAFAAQHDLGMLPAGERETEVVEPMRQRLAGDGDAEAARVGEVGQALLTRRVLLAEDHVALRAMQRLPMPDAALQRAAYVWRQVRVTAEHLVEHGDRAQAGGGLQHGNDLGVPDCRKRIGASPAAWRLALGGQPGIGIQPGAGAGTDTGTCCGELPGLGLAMMHVQSRLLVGDVGAGYEAIPWEGHRRTPAQTSRNRRQAPVEEPASQVLIDGKNHPDCR